MPTKKPAAPHGLAGRTGPDANASKPPEKKRPHIYRFRATDAEASSYEAAATRAGKSVSAWMRDVLNKAARRS